MHFEIDEELARAVFVRHALTSTSTHPELEMFRHHYADARNAGVGYRKNLAFSAQKKMFKGT